MLKAIAHRPVQAVVIATLSAVVTACAVLTPLYQRALDQASAQVQLDNAARGATTLQLTSSGLLPSTYGGPNEPVPALTPDELERLVPASLRRSFGAAIDALSVDVSIPDTGTKIGDGPVLWRQDVCAHLQMSEGRCPTGAREIAVSTGDAEYFGWRPGMDIAVDEAQDTGALDAPVSMVLTVSGVYRTPVGRYWDGWYLTGRSGTKADRTEVLRDTWITGKDTFSVQPAWRSPNSRIDLPLDRASTGVDELRAIGSEVTRFQHEQSKRSPYVASVAASSGLPTIADSVAEARHQSRVTIPSLMVPLGVLGLVVLWMALGAAVEQRRPELAVARLRGRGTRGAQAHLLRELLTVVLAGVAVGFLAALGLSWPMRHLLPADVPVELPLSVWIALLVALGAVTAAVVLVSTGISREPIVALLRRVPARRSGWGLGTADAIVVTAAASMLGAFVTGRLTGPIALAAPAVLALAAGLVLARLLISVATRWGQRLLFRGRTALGVALLQLGRRPGGRATIAVLTVSAGILVFAGDAVAVGARNRDLAAAQGVGAPVVATVSGGTVHDLESALASTGLPGRTVTPVVVQPPQSDADQAHLYVDTKSYAEVATFPDRAAARDAMSRLVGPHVDPIEVTGSQLSVRLHTESFYKGADNPVELAVQLLRKDGTLLSVPLGELPPGTSAPRDLDVPIDCAGGCVLTGWKVSTEPANRGSGRIVVGPLSTDQGRPVPLGGTHDWPIAASAGSKVEPISADGDTLTLFVDNPGSSELVLTHRWVPPELPAVVSGSLPPDSNGKHFTGVGLDGVARSMTMVSRLPWLPASGRDAAISDLGLATRTGAALGDDAELQVWFAHDEPREVAAVTKALEQHDMTITNVARVSEVKDTLDDSAATWSLELGVLVGVACLLVALLGLAIAAAGSWRPRARDLAILRLNGVSGGDTRRISVGEQLPGILVAVLTGAITGVVAAHYVLPTLPLLTEDPQVDLIDLSAAWTTVALLTVAAAAALAAFGWAVALLLSRRATPDRLVVTQ